MSEAVKAKVHGTDEVITVEDAAPIASAVEFKDLSDKIWAQRPEGVQLAVHDIPSNIAAPEVRDALNEIVSEIDYGFIISGTGKALDLGNHYGEGEPVIIDADSMDKPTAARVETFNRDARNTFRYVDVGEERKAAIFIGGHRDYYRELGIKLQFGESAVATYSMQRMQAQQDACTSLHLRVFHMAFAEMGYEGHQIAGSAISEEQETRVLDLMQKMLGEEES